MVKILLKIIAFLAVVIVGAGIYLKRDLPSIAEMQKAHRKASISFLNEQGYRIGLYGDSVGDIINIKDLPQYSIDALLSIEDQRFFQHLGIDFRSLFRAFYQNWTSKGHLQGGSTITQQLAKNFLISAEKFGVYERSYKRKIQELFLTFWLEWNFSKEDILKMYLNRSYFGSGAIGIDAASKRYFGKSCNELSLSESAMLMGLVKAPSAYSPHKSFEHALKRSHLVLKNMLRLKKISSQDYQNALKSPPTIIPPEEGGNSTRYFFDWILESMPNLIGSTQEDLNIVTTLDIKIQKIAHLALNQFLDKTPKTEGAVVVMDMGGKVLSLVGGKSYKKSSFNRATQGERQSGSLFKLFVYTTALQQGYKPTDILEDKRRRYGKWSPKNHTEKYWGHVSLCEAFSKSLNTVAVELTNQIGVDKVIKTSRDMGLISKIPKNLSISLGTSDHSLLELTSAYGIIPSGGIPLSPFGILKIEDSNHQIKYLHEPQIVFPVLENDVVQNMDFLLKSVVKEGTGRKAQVSNIEIAGKTGTSQNYKDAWFIGYTKDYIIGVWLGNDDGSSLKKVTGGMIPALIFKKIIEDIHTSPPESMESILESLSN